MYKVNIFGAGSIGNHLARAFRTKGWSVTLSDIDPKALDRTKNEIYKSRYGKWDDAIRLCHSRDLLTEPADIVFVGTPPDSHMAIALEVLRNYTPKVLLIEKPLCGPDLINCQELFEAVRKAPIHALVGYDHVVAKSCIISEELIKNGILGLTETISCRTREHWGGIFNAHPWLSGPQDSYLGYSSRGGGAIGEHSHAINLWQHFAHIIKAGKVVEVSAKLVFEKDANYDKLGIATFVTEAGLAGDLIQDVVTFPAEKLARIQGTDGFVEMRVNYNTEGDAVISGQKNKPTEITIIPKKRPDDFLQEANHIEALLNGSTKYSPISLERGLDTMMVIAAIFKSHQSRRPVEITWSKGYTPDALK